MVDPIPWHVGPVSETAAMLLAALTALYAGATAGFAYKAYRAGLEDRLSAALAAMVMSAMAWLWWSHGAIILPAPFSIFVLVMAAAGIIITLTWSLGRYQERIEAYRDRFGQRLNALLQDTPLEERLEELQRLRERWRPSQEQRRKAPHLLMGALVLPYLGLGLLALRGLWEVAYGGDASSTGEGIRNLFLASHSGISAAGHIFALTILLSVLYLVFPNEWLRLRFPELSYPFKQVILDRLRPKEQGLFGAHYYIAATLPLAMMWVARDSATWDVTVPAVVAILLVTVFADSASALIGRRFGRSKWPHHPGKSYMGTFAGTLVAVVVAAPFVGIDMGLISGAVFFVIDVLAPVPLNASDNLLNPLGLALTYTVGEGLLRPMVSLTALA